MSRRSLTTVLLGAGLTLGSTQALACADAAAVATSRRLGAEAGGLAAAGDFDGALERYRAALTVLPVTPACEAPRGELQALIARCLERLCRLDEALAVHRMRLGVPGATPKGRLSLVLGAGVEGAVVRAPGGEPLDTRCPGGYSVAPGTYRVEARGPGGPFEASAVVTSGQATTLRLDAPLAPVSVAPAAASVEAVAAPGPSAPPEPETGCTSCRTWAWIGVGTSGAAAVGAAIAYGSALAADEDMTAAASRQRRLVAATPPDPEGAARAEREAEDARETRDTLRPVTYALLGLGLASAAFAVVMFELSPETHPAAGPEGAGPTLGFRF